MAVSVVLDPMQMLDNETELVREAGAGGLFVVVKISVLAVLVVHDVAALTMSVSFLQKLGAKVTVTAVSLGPAPFILLIVLGDDPVPIVHTYEVALATFLIE